MLDKNIRFALFVLLIISPVQYVNSATSYATDQLTVPMRTGPSNRHKIIKFLEAGSALKTFEKSDDGIFTKVIFVDEEKKEKEGWVKTKNLMKNRSARNRQPGLFKKIKKLKSTVKELDGKRVQLEQSNTELKQEIMELSEQLKELRIVSRNPAAIADKNKKLSARIKKVDQQNAELAKENIILADENIKKWFMIGGGVALISLFFGLIIPSFSWGRKKKGWGGDF